MLHKQIGFVQHILVYLDYVEIKAKRKVTVRKLSVTLAIRK